MDSIPFFSELEPTDRDEFLHTHFEAVEANTGDVICAEGDVCNDFFVIARGVFDVIICGSKVADMSTGVFFGEIALLFEGVTVRSATVVAASRGLLLKLSSQSFQIFTVSLSEHVRDAPSPRR